MITIVKSVKFRPNRSNCVICEFPNRFKVASEELGIPHPPGYPFLAISLRIWNGIFKLFFQDASMIAFTSALYSSTVASCSNVLLFHLLLQCCHSTTISIFGVTIFSFSHRYGFTYSRIWAVQTGLAGLIMSHSFSMEKNKTVKVRGNGQRNLKSLH